MLLAVMCIFGAGTAWGDEVTYTLTIDTSDFNSTSYAANNNEKTSSAVCTTDATQTYEVKWTSNQIMLQSDVMQWQKNSGSLYNSTDLGTINSVTVNSTAGTFTTYYGTSEQPSSGTTVGGGYFQIKVGNATGKTTSVVIEFTIDTSAPSKIDPALAFSSQTASATIGHSFTAPTLTNTYNVNVDWSSSDESVATVSNGTVTLEGEGTTIITASYDGDDTYTSSSASYTLTVTDPNVITLWSENFSAYTANQVPSGGAYNYLCTNGGTNTKIYADVLAGGTSPELLISKKASAESDGGSFTAIIPLSNASGKLTLTYKTNAQGLSVSTTTDGITGGGSFSSTGTHTVTFTGVTTSMKSITIVFTATSTSNVRLDDIELRGNGQLLTVSTPTFSLAEGSFLEAQTVEISCPTEGATIYYSFDNTNWTEYTEALTISETKTIYAKATKGSLESEIISRTYTITSVIDVATALDKADDTEIYVSGIISRVDNYSSNSITYYISDDGTTSNELMIYKGKGLNGANFNAIGDLQVGDIVVVNGTLTTYNDVKELKSGSKIISLTTKSEPGIAFETTSYIVTPNSTFETPTLTNPNNLTVTYSISENDGVASIDANTGDVTIGENEGTVTVTATFAGNETYRAGTASYTIKVKAPNVIILEAGSRIAITEFPSFTGSGYQSLTDYTITLSDGTQKDWEVIDGMKQGGLQLKAKSGRLVSPEIRTPLGYTVTVNYTSQTEMTLTSGEATATGTVTDEELGTQEVSLTVESTAAAFTLAVGEKFAVVNSITITAIAAPVTVTLNKYGYATLYYSDKAFIVPESVTATTYNDNVEVSTTYVAEDVIPAGEAVVLQGTANAEISFVETTTTDEADANNALKGLDEAGLTQGDGKFYMLSAKNGVVGFYWGEEGGAAFNAGAHKAYLVIPASKAKEAYYLNDEATGIEKIDNTQFSTDKVYNLNGQRVDKNYKGVVIVNGKKMINK